MYWWLLTLPITTMVFCLSLNTGADTELHFILHDTVILLLDYPDVGPPIPHCESSYYIMHGPQHMMKTEVVDVPGLKERGYRVQIVLKGTSVTCRVVSVDEDPQCLQMTCPFGWSLLHETCFLVTSFVGSWEEGQSFCQQRGGTLATISSKTQQTALSHILSRDTWIGLKLKDGSYIYGWADGSTYAYASWGKGDPSSLDTPDPKSCVEMREKYDFQWNDVDCDQLKLCLCSVPGIAVTAIKSNRSPTATSGTAHKPKCPPGWVRYQSSCYKVFYEKLSYLQAKTACRRNGANLASVHSEEESSFITNHTRESTLIGLTDYREEDKFTWDDGSLLTYVRWGPNEPNDHNAVEDCVEVLVTGEWNDLSCDLRRHYVCKK